MKKLSGLALILNTVDQIIDGDFVVSARGLVSFTRYVQKLDTQSQKITNITTTQKKKLEARWSALDS